MSSCEPNDSLILVVEARFSTSHLLKCLCFFENSMPECGIFCARDIDGDIYDHLNSF